MSRTDSTGSRTIAIRRFADDIDGLAGEEKKTGKIDWVSQQSLHSLRHGGQCREDQADDNTSGINTEIKVNGQKLETVTNFK